MKRIWFLLLSVLYAFGGLAQDPHAISIQSDNNQAFYVMLDKKTFHSNTSGSVVIPNLKDSNYQLTVGLSDNRYGEYLFQVHTGGKYKNFQLKKNGNKEWYLVDLQSMESIKPLKSTRVQGDDISEEKKSTDAFAIMMAGVVNDTAVLYIPVQKPIPPPIKDTAQVQADLSTQKPGAETASVVKGTKPDADPKGSNTNKKGDSATALAKKKDTDAAKKAGTTAVVVGSASKTKVSSKAPVTKSPKDSSKAVVGSGAKKLDSAKTVESKTPANAKDTLAMVVVATGLDSKSGKTDSGTVTAPTTAKPKQSDSTAVLKDASSKNPSIIKLGEKNLASGLQLKFIDSTGVGSIDTITLLIADQPEPLKDTLTAASQPEMKINTPADSTKSSVGNKPAPAKVDTVTKAVIIANKTPEKITSDTSQNKAAGTPKVTAMINSDCQAFANTQDVDKLRVKMIGENNIDDRVTAAKKVFRTKCFATKQVKALSELFLTDEGRYKFFDAAYPFVSDTDSFRQLVSLLKDPYYINRFNAMLRSN